jgi:hypothetical protein
MRRREFFVALTGSVAALPFRARAQQHRLPAIGFLNGAGRDEGAVGFRAFHKGLSEEGFSLLPLPTNKSAPSWSVPRCYLFPNVIKS